MHRGHSSYLQAEWRCKSVEKRYIIYWFFNDAENKKSAIFRGICGYNLFTTLALLERMNALEPDFWFRFPKSNSWV